MNLKKIIDIVDRLLTESISDDPATNNLIEKTIETWPREEHSQALDALEALRHVGKAGLTGAEWVKAYRDVRGDSGRPDVDIVIKVAKAFFGQCVEKNGDRYVWITEGTADIPQAERNAIGAAVDVTSAMLEKAKRLKTFNVGALVRVAMAAGMNSAMAEHKALEFINHFPKLFKNLGGGQYEYQEEDKQDAMSLLRDIARRASQGRTED